MEYECLSNSTQNFEKYLFMILWMTGQNVNFKKPNNNTQTQNNTGIELPIMGKEICVHTHRVLCHNPFVNFIEFLCIGSIHIELWGRGGGGFNLQHNQKPSSIKKYKHKKIHSKIT